MTQPCACCGSEPGRFTVECRSAIAGRTEHGRELTITPFDDWKTHEYEVCERCARRGGPPEPVNKLVGVYAAFAFLILFYPGCGAGLLALGLSDPAAQSDWAIWIGAAILLSALGVLAWGVRIWLRERGELARALHAGEVPEHLGWEIATKIARVECAMDEKRRTFFTLVQYRELRARIR